MKILLLALIYLAFISLGLPDGLLGAAWPSMYQGMAVPLSFAGYVTMEHLKENADPIADFDEIIRDWGWHA